MSLKLANSTSPGGRLGHGGFTLPEVLVATGVILLMTVATLLLLRPTDHTAELLKAERQLELASLTQALKRYKAAQGHLPTDVPATRTVIGAIEGAYDLCKVLVPTYLKDIPLDPETGVKYLSESNQTQAAQPCNEEGVDYVSGYTIVQAKTGGITLAAPTTGKDAMSITVR